MTKQLSTHVYTHTHTHTICSILAHLNCDDSGQSAYHGHHHRQQVTRFSHVFCLASLSFIGTFCSTDGVPNTITDFLHEKNLFPSSLICLKSL